MANAGQVAATRVATAVAAITDRLKIVSLDPRTCDAVTNPSDALDGTFSALGIEDHQMPFFRTILAGLCPEIRDEILDESKLPMNAGMKIGPIVDFVEAALDDSPQWHGQCMPRNS